MTDPSLRSGVRLSSLLLVLACCDRSPTAPLIELSGITPKRIELGDKLEIEGASLPEGRDARVVLRGTLHRPGEAPLDAEIDTTGRVMGRDRIEVPVSSELVSSFCGEESLHTTFSGEVTVIFMAAAPGAPPVTGSIAEAEIDVIPEGRRAESLAGERVLAELGIHLVGEHESMGVVVLGVEPASLATRAGIAADDRIVSFDGVRVVSPADIALPPGAVRVPLTVTHGASATEETLSIPVDGLAPPAHSRVSFGLAIAALALAAVLALFGPVSRRVAWLERRLGAGSPTSPSIGALAALLGAIVTLPLSRVVFGARIDLGLIVSTLLIASGALSASRARGPRQVMKRSMLLVLRAIPAVIALSVACVRHGSLSADDAMRAQGALPWEWAASRSVLGLLLLGMMVAPWALPSDDPQDAGDDAAAVFACSVAVTLFLGGWRWSGAEAGLWGTLLFAGKTAALYILCSWVRRSLPPIGGRPWLRVLVPLCLAVGALEMVLQRAGSPPFAAPLAFAVLGALAMTIAVRSKRRIGGRPEANVVL